jgi:hypothetical protein
MFRREKGKKLMRKILEEKVLRKIEEKPFTPKIKREKNICKNF